VSALKTRAALQTRIRYRNMSVGRWRPDRIGRFSGASNRRRDPEPCGPLAGRATKEKSSAVSALENLFLVIKINLIMDNFAGRRKLGWAQLSRVNFELILLVSDEPEGFKIGSDHP
jgi:hypothetical protein